jgi:hypothetical protein
VGRLVLFLLTAFPAGVVTACLRNDRRAARWHGFYASQHDEGDGDVIAGPPASPGWPLRPGPERQRFGP